MRREFGSFSNTGYGLTLGWISLFLLSSLRGEGSGWTSLLASYNSEESIVQQPHAAQPNLVNEDVEAQELAPQIKMNTNEWRASDRHFSLCETKINNIISEIHTRRDTGQLDLPLEDPKDIERGVNVYFSDLPIRFNNNKQRLGLINRMLQKIGNQNSRLWNDLLQIRKDF